MKYTLKGSEIGPMPAIGFGTYKLNGEDCIKAVEEALELGYRHIDTAIMYGNQQAIGRAIRTIPREQLFITSKLFLPDLPADQIMSSAENILEELHTSYLDLLLIHWPRESSMEQDYKLLVEVQKKGLAKYLGVSNFSSRQMQAALDAGFPILTNQIEVHPYLQQQKLVNYCESKNVIVTAYRPLGSGKLHEDQVLAKIGSQYGKTAAQVALRWLVQNNMVVIPKSAHTQRMRENIEIFDFTLSQQDLALIAALERHQRFCEPSFAKFEEESAHEKQ